MTTLSRSFNELRSPSKRFSLPDAERLSAPAEEDEDDLNQSSDSEEHETNISLGFDMNQYRPSQRPSAVSFIASSVLPDRTPTRSYKFVQLERALAVANLLDDNNDRLVFQREYRQSIRDNQFEQFLQKWNQKLKDHKEKLERECVIKNSPSFIFVDLEKNFLALDPTRAIKIVFLDDDEPKPKFHRHSTLSNTADEDSVEAFYRERSRHLLRNPSRARNEITLLARQSAEHLDQRLPHLTDVPHRVKIVDERERKENFDEHTLRQMKHKHALGLINKRRQLTLQMLNQSRKNQMKMARLNFQPPLSTVHSSSCRELLDRVNQMEQSIKQEKYQRPQTSFIPQRAMSKTTIYSPSQTTTSDTSPSFSSTSTPFPVFLSMHHVEKTDRTRVMVPRRSFSAPTKKMTWANYC